MSSFYEIKPSTEFSKRAEIESSNEKLRKECDTLQLRLLDVRFKAFDRKKHNKKKDIRDRRLPRKPKENTILILAPVCVPYFLHLQFSWKFTPLKRDRILVPVAAGRTGLNFTETFGAPWKFNEARLTGQVRKVIVYSRWPLRWSTIILLCLREFLVGVWRPAIWEAARLTGTVVDKQLAIDGARPNSFSFSGR